MDIARTHIHTDKYLNQRIDHRNFLKNPKIESNSIFTKMILSFNWSYQHWNHRFFCWVEKNKTRKKGKNPERIIESLKSVWIWLENVSMDLLVVTVFIFHFLSLSLFLSYMVNFQPDQMINFWSIKMMKWMVEWLKTYYCLKCLHHQYCCCCCWKTKSKSMLTTAILKFQK